MIKFALPKTTTGGKDYEPRPQSNPVDYTAIGQLAIKRFPKVLAELAK